MVELIKIRSATLKAGRSFRVTFTYLGQRREAVRMKYTRKGQLLFIPISESDKVGVGHLGQVNIETGTGVKWLEGTSNRNHMTLHPSDPTDPVKSKPAVHADDGIYGIGLDLRTLKKTELLCRQRLTVPLAYPTAAKGDIHITGLYGLTREWPGAPIISFWATPIDPTKAATQLSKPSENDAYFTIAPDKLGDIKYLVQMNIGHEEGLRLRRAHVTSFPTNASSLDDALLKKSEAVADEE